MKSRKTKTKKPKEMEMLPILKKSETILCDETHVIGYGMFEQIDKKILKNYYSEICFNLEFLEMAKKYFESTRMLDPLIRVYVPNKPGPIVFVAESDQIYSKKKRMTFYAIAPRVEQKP